MDQDVDAHASLRTRARTETRAEMKALLADAQPMQQR